MKPVRDSDLSTEISSLLSEQAQCVLATIDDTSPCQHMMAYAYSEDLFTIYLATLMDTRKFRNMLSNPRVSMMWDNRSGKARDHVEGTSLTATGKAFLLEGADHELASNLVAARNSTLRSLLSDEDCRLFSVELEEYTWTRGYRMVYQLRPDWEKQGKH